MSHIAVSHFAIGLAALCTFAVIALVVGKFIAFGDGPRPMNAEEVDRAALNAFYREIALLLLGIAIGACLFCLFAGLAIAHQLSN